MASNISVRPLQNLVRRIERCRICAKSVAVQPYGKPIRKFSTTFLRPDEQEAQERPRWSYTPPLMKAPVQPHLRNPKKAFTCNNNPAKLDAMYNTLLGPGGGDVLSEEVKWLAVTHKSFDQGRRGFNDRLAYFGKRIVLLRTVLALLHSSTATTTQLPPPLDPYCRTPFQHPDLEGLPNLTVIETKNILAKDRLGDLAKSYGIDKVTRWKPKNPQSLTGSGKKVVYATSLYAIVGALSLHNGGDVANQFTREKILKPLGIQ